LSQFLSQEIILIILVWLNISVLLTLGWILFLLNKLKVHTCYVLGNTLLEQFFIHKGIYSLILYPNCMSISYIPMVLHMPNGFNRI